MQFYTYIVLDYTSILSIYCIGTLQAPFRIIDKSDFDKNSFIKIERVYCSKFSTSNYYLNNLLKDVTKFLYIAAIRNHKLFI